MSQYVAVFNDDELLVHAADAHGTYATLCGLDGDDPNIGQSLAEVPPGKRIDCQQCKAILEKAWEYKRRDLEI